MKYLVEPGECDMLAACYCECDSSSGGNCSCRGEGSSKDSNNKAVAQ